MKYDQLKQKQMTEEQEKRLEEEIMRKLSSVDQVLSKAKAKISTLQIEEAKGVGRKEVQKEETKKRVDLYAVFVDEGENKTKSPAISRLREMKKECSNQVKELERQEEAVKTRVKRKIKKIGLMAKNAASKAERGGPEIEEIS